MTTLTESDPKDDPKPEKVNEFGAGIGALHAFRYKDYRWLWAGNTFSSAAMWIQQTTIGWLAYDLTGSGALLGTLQSVRNLPPLVTAPLAGVFADRYSRNTVSAWPCPLFINARASLPIASRLEISHLSCSPLPGGLNAFTSRPVRPWSSTRFRASRGQRDCAE